MQIIPISDATLEKIAEEFLADHGQGHLDGFSLLIEPLIESVGFTIFPVKGLSEIAEAYLPLKSGYIFVDEDQYMSGGSPRWRFTLAEELAHSLIHRPMFEGKTVYEIIALQNEITDSEYEKMEKEAKYLAGALLMPKSVFTKRFEHFYEIHSQRVTNKLAILRGVLKELNMDFNVSNYAICIRAWHLDLLDWQEIDDYLSRYSRS